MVPCDCNYDVRDDAIWFVLMQFYMINFILCKYYNVSSLHWNTYNTQYSHNNARGILKLLLVMHNTQIVIKSLKVK